MRPTAEELLSSDLLPPAQLEDDELHDVVRHVLANPQSKSYRNLVARSLAQQSDAVLELTYHLGFIQTNRKLEYVKVGLFFCVIFKFHLKIIIRHNSTW